MTYSESLVINKNIGNNSLSFDERISTYGKAEIRLPSLKVIETSKQIELGNHIVLEEINEKGRLHSCTGLKHIYELENSKTKNNILIMDNHNHALFFWAMYMSHNKITDPVHILHIDQHSDLNTPKIDIDTKHIDFIEYLREYTNYGCQISSFIKPFQSLYPTSTFQWVKSESELLEIKPTIHSPIIVDIDLDFWAPEMSIEKKAKTLSITRQLIQLADVTTIATSPMFLDQKIAIDLLGELLP